MFRRFISMLVALGLLASHLAVVPHAHGGMAPAERQEHDATPHFHLPLGGGVHAHHLHGHHHAHGHHHGHGHVVGSHHEHANPLESHPIRTDYDADAVYLPIAIGEPATTNVDDIGASASHFVVQPGITIWISQLGADATASRCWHPPESLADAAPLYLTLRTLRI